MKKVSMMYLPCIFLAMCPLAGAQSVSKCFRADWLQGERAVDLKIEGSRVTGAFKVFGDGSGNDGTRAAATYKFSGTRSGNNLTVAFVGNKLPDVAPSEMKSLVWTLVKRGEQESLRIKFTGKNYETNKYEDRFADFESCTDASYAALLKTAQAVRFAKGANSSSIALASRREFQAMQSPAAFTINLAKSQSLEISADGCSIEVYLPDRKLYKFVEWENENKTERTYNSSQIDRLLIEPLPQSGTYLIIVRKAAENMRPEKVTFKATN